MGDRARPTRDRERVPSFTLGVADVSPLEMAEAYATFAARGMHCDSRPVTSIEDSDGNVLKEYPTQCKQVMAKGTADAVNDILRGVQETGLRRPGRHQPRRSRPPARPAPSTSNMAVWFVRLHPQPGDRGDDRRRQQPGPLDHPQRPDASAASYVDSAHGSGYAGPMWGDAMKTISAWLPDEDFVAPDSDDGVRRAGRGAEHRRHERQRRRGPAGGRRLLPLGRRRGRLRQPGRHGGLHLPGGRLVRRQGLVRHHLPVHRPPPTAAATAAGNDGGRGNGNGRGGR